MLVQLRRVVYLLVLLQCCACVATPEILGESLQEKISTGGSAKSTEEYKNVFGEFEKELDRLNAEGNRTLHLFTRTVHSCIIADLETARVIKEVDRLSRNNVGFANIVDGKRNEMKKLVETANTKKVEAVVASSNARSETTKIKEVTRKLELVTTSLNSTYNGFIGFWKSSKGSDEPNAELINLSYVVMEKEKEARRFVGRFAEKATEALKCVDETEKRVMSLDDKLSQLKDCMNSRCTAKEETPHRVPTEEKNSHGKDTTETNKEIQRTESLVPTQGSNVGDRNMERKKNDTPEDSKNTNEIKAKDDNSKKDSITESHPDEVKRVNDNKADIGSEKRNKPLNASSTITTLFL
ncbi:hypothetical protein LSM04_008421 [Trypanosoma melophagium]|uniref:uncharacterized protein n=1 Tax=Trypanosoma melophagium TaxID=715481 RepID=UPI00351A4498|nr:hypothetical protein LSM04_008421 [Trypanosoma melophagium]